MRRQWFHFEWFVRQALDSELLAGLEELLHVVEEERAAAVLLLDHDRVDGLPPVQGLVHCLGLHLRADRCREAHRDAQRAHELLKPLGVLTREERQLLERLRDRVDRLRAQKRPERFEGRQV